MILFISCHPPPPHLTHTHNKNKKAHKDVDTYWHHAQWQKTQLQTRSKGHRTSDSCPRPRRHRFPSRLTDRTLHSCPPCRCRRLQRKDDRHGMFTIIMMEIYEVPTLQLKALNRHNRTCIMRIDSAINLTSN